MGNLCGFCGNIFFSKNPIRGSLCFFEIFQKIVERYLEGGIYKQTDGCLRDTLIKMGYDKNYVWTKVGPNPSRIHKTTKNMILYKNLMFIFSFLLYFSRYCRSKNDHSRLFYRTSFMNTCSPYASVSANWSKIRTFL